MHELFGVPVHPAAVHFPVAAVFFAAGAYFVALVRPDKARAAWSNGGAVLLLVALVTLPGAVVTGRAWAESLGFLEEGALLPGPLVFEGNLRRHAVVASIAGALVLLGLVTALLARRKKVSIWLPFALSLLASGAMAYTGHLGGTMVHGSLEKGEGAR